MNENETVYSDNFISNLDKALSDFVVQLPLFFEECKPITTGEENGCKHRQNNSERPHP